ncbi:MAG: dienelactone hydrolase family protein [Alphaproteobacteria bacterium]|nr:dienelactone hydrolase family protein [Alphaproteobacteria bacterium]
MSSGMTCRGTGIDRVRMALLAVLVGGCVTDGSSESVRFAPLPNTQPGSMQLPAAIHRPDGAGPFPAIILLHGCGGVQASHHEHARQLRDEGYLVAVVDSFVPRGLHGGICVRDLTTRADAEASFRIKDAQAAAAYLRSRGDVDPKRIGLLGFSHGGATALHGAIPQLHEWRPLPSFKAVVAYYPWCELSLLKGIDTPTLVLIGTADDWTPVERCETMKQLLERPERVDLVTYPGVHHGFDVPGSNSIQPCQAGRCTLRHDTAAAADAWRRTREWFARHLK